MEISRTKFYRRLLNAGISALLPDIKRLDESTLEVLGSPVFFFFEAGLDRMLSEKAFCV